MTEGVMLPIYETLLTEAIGSLAIDSGTVSISPPAGAAVLQDDSKDWSVDVHRGRLVKIIHGAGAGQLRVILSNSDRLLTLNQLWTVLPDPTSVYVIYGMDVMQCMRDVLGGGVNIDLGNEFDQLKTVLSVALEASLDSGTATGGTNATIVDAAKNWQNNMWLDGIAEVEIAGVRYLRLITANTADTVAINALPGGVVCAAGCPYSLKRPVTLADVSDRAARLLGVVQSITQWAGVALTGRDISLDLANLDVALSGRASEATLVEIIPVAKAAVFNTALPAAEADWIGAAITPTNSPSYLRIYACVSVAGVLRVARTISGVTLTENLNSGDNLVAGAAYMFTIPWRTTDSINIRYSVTAGTINRLLIDEIGGGE